MPYPDNAMNDMLERQALIDKINDLQGKLEEYNTLLKKFQDICKHPNLPYHEIGESFMDKCPDCGFISYCYEL